MNDESKHYPHDSVGGAMIYDVPHVTDDKTAAYTRDYLLKGIHKFDTISYVYVIDFEGRLVGTLSIKELFSADLHKKVSEIMTRDPFALHPTSDQEKAVVMALHHNIKAVPVVDHDRKLLGVIKADKILRILHSEHVEDLLQVAGVKKSIYEITHLGKETVLDLVRRRMPSLIVGLLTGVVAALWINRFERVIEMEFLFASFIPAIVYLSDAVGTQAQILFIRDLTFSELFKVSKYLGRELKITTIISLVLAIIFVATGFILGGSWILVITLGFTVVFSVFAAALTALLIPWIMNKMKKDPAMASGPFATALSDVISLLIYFTTASLVIRLFL